MESSTARVTMEPAEHLQPPGHSSIALGSSRASLAGSEPSPAALEQEKLRALGSRQEQQQRQGWWLLQGLAMLAQAGKRSLCACSSPALKAALALGTRILHPHGSRGQREHKDWAEMGSVGTESTPERGRNCFFGNTANLCIKNVVWKSQGGLLINPDKGRDQ